MQHRMAYQGEYFVQRYGERQAERTPPSPIQRSSRRVTAWRERSSLEHKREAVSATLTDTFPQVKVVVDAPQIELVSGAGHPLVFGDELLQYLTQLVMLFNTHMHPGEMAIGILPVTPMVPVAQMVPPTPDLLSLQVKTG